MTQRKFISDFQEYKGLKQQLQFGDTKVIVQLSGYSSTLLHYIFNGQRSITKKNIKLLEIAKLVIENRLMVQKDLIKLVKEKYKDQ